MTVVKNLPAYAREDGNMGSITGSGRSPGGENGNPLQYSCLGNSMDRRAWQAYGGCKELDMTEYRLVIEETQGSSLALEQCEDTEEQALTRHLIC